MFSASNSFWATWKIFCPNWVIKYIFYATCIRSRSRFFLFWKSQNKSQKFENFVGQMGQKTPKLIKEISWKWIRKDFIQLSRKRILFKCANLSRSFKNLEAENLKIFKKGERRDIFEDAQLQKTVKGAYFGKQ